MRKITIINFYSVLHSRYNRSTRWHFRVRQLWSPLKDVLAGVAISYTPRPSRTSASIDFAAEPKSRPSEAICLRCDDRTSGPRPVPESQERSKIGLGREKVR